MPSLELRIPPPVIALISVAMMIWLQGFYPLSLLQSAGAVAFALATGCVGCFVMAGGLVAFRQARTTVNPLQPGKTTTLVTTGVYRYTRNPMYLGMALVLAGIAIYLAELTAFLMLALFVRFISRYQIQPEERILAEKFGDDFQEYMDRVGRWL
jgi:protein-S-isoprenylcysteine O-methyltransferase Ste14